MIFFNPHPKFWTYIKKIIGMRTLVDCGCGDGLLLDQARHNRIDIIGIDFLNMSYRSDVIPMKSEAFWFNRNNLPIMCRPCRGEWIHETIHNAMKKGCKEFLYVGVQRNLKDDIDNLRNQYTISLEVEDVGTSDEKEFLYSIKPMKTEEQKSVYFLVKTRYWEFPSWVEELNARFWVNYNGGHNPRSSSDKILKTQEANDYTELDWSMCGLTSDLEEGGWLSPEGTFYGCHYSNHDLVASLILKCKVENLEKFGWIRIHSKKELTTFRPITDAQKNFLNKKGYTYESN